MNVEIWLKLLEPPMEVSFLLEDLSEEEVVSRMRRAAGKNGRVFVER